MLEKPAFIQGLFLFESAGLDKPVALPVRAIYQVPHDKRAQSVCLRAGNPSDGFAGAKGAIHVPVAVAENIFPGARTEILALDPVSKMPEFKVCAVRIGKETAC